MQCVQNKPLPAYVQCIPSWGIPALTAQTKAEETITKKNSIAASLGPPHSTLTAPTGFLSICEVRVEGGVDISAENAQSSAQQPGVVTGRTVPHL